MLWVKSQPCCARFISYCDGPIEADHAGRRGLGQKCDDRECIPLCAKHHRERTDMRGAFGGFHAERMREWLDRRIAETQTLAREAGVLSDL
jgi:hypothetical protein